MQEYVCYQCKSIFKRFQSQIRNPNRCFCSRHCSSKWNGLNQNPNKGKLWSSDKKDAHAQLVKSSMTEEAKWKSGSANRDKKFSEERIFKMHAHRSFESYSRPHTKESKELIGSKSRIRLLNPDYALAFRQTMEERGHWIPLSEKTIFENYWKQCQWIARMFDIIPNDNMHLGVYCSFSNSKGAVRDHKFSIKTGFDLKVFPEILRHPANCAIITHSDNIKKRFTIKDSLILDELFDLIETETYPFWAEQHIAVNRIRQYKQGIRHDLLVHV